MTARPMRSSMHSIRAAGSGPILAKTRRVSAQGLLTSLAVVALLSCVAGARRSNPATPAAAPSADVPNESAGTSQDEPSEEAAEPESSGDAHSYDDEGPPRRVRETSGKYKCESPRPRVCDATPNPVCAQVQDSKGAEGPSQDKPATVVNGCLACADPNVVSYVEGRCNARVDTFGH